jgi:secreted trypsin-like serine protease
MVLTAAHCGDDCDDCLVGGTAFVGAYQFNSTLGGAQVRTCVDFVKHPDFINSDLTDENRTDYFDNDFGLCKLNEPVYIDESTVTLELNEDSTVPSGGDEVVAIGLGFESFFDLLFFQLANITQDVTLPVAPDCSGSPYFEDPLYKLCAGGLNQGLCAGDSGGPLVKISGGVHTHVGSGSLSYNCHSFGDEPAVFARTSAGVEWIKSAICDLGSVSESCVTESPTVSPTTKKEKKGKSGKKGKEAKDTKDTKSKKSKAKKSKDKKSKDKKSKSR